MPGFERSVWIQKPVEEVFDFATDIDNAGFLMPNLTAIEMVTQGGMRPGAKFKETRRMGKREHSAVIEVVEHERPRVHAARSSMAGMSATYTFTFQPEGTGTRVLMQADVTGNLLWQLFLGWIVKLMEKEDGEFLERLKCAIESGEPASESTM